MGIEDKKTEEFRVMYDRIEGKTPRIPLYLCEYKLRTLFDQCFFGIVEVFTQESRKKGYKIASEIGIGNLLEVFGIKGGIGGETHIENEISTKMKQSISPILQLAILLSYFQKNKEVVIELEKEDTLSTLSPNSLVRFVAEPSIVTSHDEPPSFLTQTQWNNVKRLMEFESELEDQSHVAWIAKLYDRKAVATISTLKITPFGTREFYWPQVSQHILARFMGDRSGTLFMDPICIWMEQYV